MHKLISGVGNRVSPVWAGPFTNRDHLINVRCAPLGSTNQTAAPYYFKDPIALGNVTENYRELRGFKAKPDCYLLNADGNEEDEGFHTIPQTKWERVLYLADFYEIALGDYNYPVENDKPWTWETLLDPIDGPGAHPRMAKLLAHMGYDLVIQSFHRFGERVHVLSDIAPHVVMEVCPKTRYVAAILPKEIAYADEEDGDEG